MAIWKQALLNEAARTSEFFSGCTPIDLEQAYARITHEQLIRACNKHGFSLRRLKFLLLVYSGKRVIKVGEAVSMPFELNATIVAGCSYATTLLKAALLDVFDAAAKKWLRIGISLMVDDTGLQAV
eukprot:9215693-Pyramimonas_sp.AAC.1